MPARFPRGLLLGLSLLTPAAAAAQDYSYPPTGAAPGTASVSVGGDGGQFSAGPLPPEAYLEGGYGYGGGYPGGYAGGYGGGPTPDPSFNNAPPGEWWPTQSAWSIFTQKVLPNSWVRAEWVNYEIDTFGEKVIGAPFVNGQPTRNPSLVLLDNGAVALQNSPNTRDLNLDDSQGLRLTLGVPFRSGGGVEVSWWNLPEQSDRISPSVTSSEFFLGLLQTNLPDVVATPLAGAGGPSGSPGQFVVYDRLYVADFTSDVWGAEAKMLWDMSRPGTGIVFQPLVGVRAFSIEERFNQAGSTSIGGDRIARIASETDNFLLNPEIGFRAELEWWRFTFGAEPRVSAGFNYYDASVSASNLRFAGDPAVGSQDDGLEWNGMFECGLYGKFRAFHNVTLFGGYNFLYLTGVTRPIDNIVYEDVGGAPTSAVRLETVTQDMHLQGLTLGAEFRFR